MKPKSGFIFLKTVVMSQINCYHDFSFPPSWWECILHVFPRRSDGNEINSVISLAYAEDGYSQIEIANFLGLSKSAISMIIKSDKSGD